jgi:CheY-like chemotaxis protein
MPNTSKILIVDDDPELRDALTEQLSLREEFEAVAAENGSMGVQAAKAGQIDLVIMDVGLPDIELRPSWSLKRAATNWCLDRGRHDDRGLHCVPLRGFQLSAGSVWAPCAS